MDPEIIAVTHAAPVLNTEEPIYVNLNTKVTTNQIREETINGRKHFVVPSYTLPFDCVMNGGLYPKSEILANYKKLENTQAPLGHPAVNGKHVSATSPEGLALGYCGAYNKNVRLVGNRVAVDKYVDIEVANRTTQGQRLVSRLEALKAGTDATPIHTSVAVYLQREIVVNGGAGYDWIAHIKAVDHDAILLDEPGAATPDDGVGMMVNTADAKALVANAGVFDEETNYEKRDRIEKAARELFGVKDGEYIEAGEFTTKQVVIHRGDFGNAMMHAYKDESGKIVIDPAGVEVVRKSNWVQLLPNSVQKLLHSLGITQNQARPDVNKEIDMPLTAEDRAEIGKHVEALGTNMSASLVKLLEPVIAKVDGLQANQQAMLASLTANTRVEEDKKRAAVAAKFKMSPEGVAALQGNALEDLYKQCGDAAPIGDNAIQANSNPAFKMPDASTYMGKV